MTIKTFTTPCPCGSGDREVKGNNYIKNIIFLNFAPLSQWACEVQRRKSYEL